MAKEEDYNTIDYKEKLLLMEIKKDEYGGYNQNMLEKNLRGMEIDFYVCSRCNGLMRNACLVNGPDQILVCEVCIIEGEDSIPMVKARINIPKLRVKCPLVNRGCIWKRNLGEIDAHLDECTKFILSCPKMCGIILKRSELQNHCENECQLRIVNCQHCRDTMQYIELENHNIICKEYPLVCPNECLKTIIRKELKSHIDEECPNTLVSCPYAEMGCEVISKRSELQKHEETFESKHFDTTNIFYLKKMENLKFIVNLNNNNIKDKTANLQNIKEEYRDLLLEVLAKPSSRDDLIERFRINSTKNKVYTVSDFLKKLDLIGFENRLKWQGVQYLDGLLYVDYTTLTLPAYNIEMTPLQADRFLDKIKELCYMKIV